MYQDYTNRATWAVALFINNDPDVLRLWQERVRVVFRDVNRLKTLYFPGVEINNDQAARMIVEGSMRNAWKDCWENLEIGPVLSDWLRDAFESVNWKELAEEQIEKYREANIKIS